MNEVVPDWVVLLMQLNSRQAGGQWAGVDARTEEVRIGAYLKLSLPWASGSIALSHSAAPAEVEVVMQLVQALLKVEARGVLNPYQLSTYLICCLPFLGCCDRRQLHPERTFLSCHDCFCQSLRTLLISQRW